MRLLSWNKRGVRRAKIGDVVVGLRTFIHVVAGTVQITYMETAQVYDIHEPRALSSHGDNSYSSNPFMSVILTVIFGWCILRFFQKVKGFFSARLSAL